MSAASFGDLTVREFFSALSARVANDAGINIAIAINDCDGKRVLAANFTERSL